MNIKSSSTPSSSSRLSAQKWINLNHSLSRLSLIIVGEVDIEQSIRNSTRVDQKAVEHIQLWTSSLKTVNRWPHSTSKRIFNEIFHGVIIWESKDRVSLQSHKNIVRIDTIRHQRK